jgi:acetyltransferase-like isoleucine patch superfamily enzyme
LRASVSLRNLAGLWRYLLLRLRHPNLRGGLFFIGSGADLRIDRSARISIGRDVRFMRDFSGHFVGRVCIGNGVFFNRWCNVVAHERVQIGDHCLFGEMVSIHDDNHVPGGGPEPIASRGLHTAPVVIGANVWVGAKATILPGVVIGDNAVIGANAVVTQDIPARAVAAGVPARVIRTLDAPSSQPQD